MKQEWSMESKSEDKTHRQTVAEAKKTADVEYADSYYRFKEKRAYWQSVLHDDQFNHEKQLDHEAELSRSMLIVEQYERYFNTGDPYLLM
jgi:hypothetical protein